jgi:hypothetical protein
MNGARELPSAAEGLMADDDIVYLVTSNEDLITTGLSPERDDDIRDATAVLFGVDVGSGPALIDLDGGDASAVTTATGTVALFRSICFGDCISFACC